MDILDNEVNQRIMAGNLPTVELHPASIDQFFQTDIAEQAKAGLSILMQNPDLFYTLIIGFRNRVAELDLLRQSELYLNGVNYLINAKCHEDYLTVNGSLNIAGSINPVVTQLDKVLWYGAYAYYMEKELHPKKEEYNLDSMMYAWVYLLELAQKMEFNYGQTIDISVIRPNTPIIEILTGNYSDSKTCKSIRALTSSESVGIKRLFEKRKALLLKIQDEKKTGKEVADKTESEWLIFLDIINDLSEKEANVIHRILESQSPKEKIKVINEYNSIVYGIEHGHYYLKGTEIRLIPVLEAVNERIQNASSYTSVYIEGGKPFRVHPALFVLLIMPETYNYLFITFHHFRLSPSKETAKRFVSLALSCIKKNLGGEDNKWFSLDEMITEFTSTVFDYIHSNQSAIEQLSFSKLQPNMVITDGMSLEAIDVSEIFNESTREKMRDYTKSDKYESEIERLVKGKETPRSVGRILDDVKKAEAEYAKLEDKAIAHRIIVSLNIVYMFCDALRIMLNNKHAHIKVKRPEEWEHYRRDLLKLDADLVHKVYGHLDEQEIGMLEYREKAGVIATNMSEQEIQEEAYRSSLFSEILKEAIDQYVVGIEEMNPDQILQIKGKIRAEILRFPDCDEKERYGAWLDSISERISAALVEICKKEQENYQNVKEQILIALGKSGKKLPNSTVDSLTTAEMLYSRYATEEFANKGFDFSCISALYYQAFEDAYNDQIWHGYAQMLNALVVNGKKYTDILYHSRKIESGLTDPDAEGYLDNSSKQRKYYLKSTKKTDTTVALRCMYMSFGIIMSHVCASTNLPGFCEYFAKLAGFDSRTDMFSDADFMLKCKDFANSIISSADNRNNASHGGSFISISQCTDDKKTVLNNLEAVRSTSIGLIQQLLYVMYRT